MRRLKKVKIDFISLVPRGATGIPVLMKEDVAGAASGKIEFTVLSKLDATLDEIHAIVYAPELRDSQGEIASAEVIKDMCHDFARRSGTLDIRHDGCAVGREKAAIVENFVIQKADPRFVGVKTSDGRLVDPTGGWGTVIKLYDADLKKLYKSGAWEGVSMGGSYLEVEPDHAAKSDAERVLEALAKKLQGEETMPITKEELQALLASNNETLLKSVDAKLNTALATLAKSEPPKTEPTKAPADEFKGDLTKISDVENLLQKVRREKLAKTINTGDEAALEQHLAELKKAAEESQKNETSEQKLARLTKENAAQALKIAKLQKAGTMSTSSEGSETPAPDDTDEEITDPSKLKALGKSMGAATNKARGYASAK